MRSIAHLEQHVATLEAEYQKLSDDSAKGENDGFTTQSFPQDRKREERERERKEIESGRGSKIVPKSVVDCCQHQDPQTDSKRARKERGRERERERHQNKQEVCCRASGSLKHNVPACSIRHLYGFSLSLPSLSRSLFALCLLRSVELPLYLSLCF